MLDQGGGNGSPLQNSCVEDSMDRGAWRVAVVLGVPRRRRNSAHRSSGASLSTAGCAWPGGSGSPGILLSGRPGHRCPPRPRSAHGALGVLARGAGGEVAVTKVRESPLGLRGPARPVSSTGPADLGLLTASLPRQHPRGRRPPRRHQALVDRRSPGSVRKPPSPTQGSVCSPSPSAASSLPARLRRQGAGHLPQTGVRLPALPHVSSRAPEPRTPRSASALLPAAALAMARSSDPRPDRFWRHASLWEGQTPSRKDGESGTDSKLTRALSPAVTRNQRRS